MAGPPSPPQAPLLLLFPLHPPTNYNCFLSFLLKFYQEVIHY